jgi:plastocyanin
LPLAILLIVGGLGIVPGAFAQAANHPAHIHQGTCDNLGDIVEPLDNVSLGEAPQLSGASSAISVLVSDTLVPLSLEDMFAADHAINIHESADNIQEYIACGAIGGPVRGGVLVIGLGELNDSGVSGVAVLTEEEGGTNVDVYLTAADDAGAADDAAADDAADDAAADDAAATADDAAADDAATDDAADDAAADDAAADDAAADDAATDDAAADDGADAATGNVITVDILNFAFNPNPIEISVGDTVTWTNQDGVPHTATGQNRDLLQSGTIPPGGTFSQTFTEPGEIPYFCEFHPNMNGVIIVN